MSSIEDPPLRDSDGADSTVHSAPWAPAEMPPPRTGGLPRCATIVESRPENPRTRIVRLDTSVRCDPGQFVMLWLPGLDEKPFSVLEPEPLALAIAAVGPFSRAVHGLGPGSPVWFRGPLGRGFRPTGRDHLLVGGGYGVAPLLFLSRRLCDSGDRVRAVVGARSSSDLMLLTELGAAGCEVLVTTEDGSAGTLGVVTDVVSRLVQSDRPDTLYACGPYGMLDAIQGLASRAGIPTQLSWEAYMRCGLGLCGSCEHRGRLLCAEGPVLGEPQLDH